MRVETTYLWGEIELLLEAECTPGRPAPPCSNHDSPAFSDSGDAALIEDIKIVEMESGRVLKYDSLHWKVQGAIFDALYDVATNAAPYDDDDQAYDQAKEDGRV